MSDDLWYPDAGRGALNRREISKLYSLVEHLGEKWTTVDLALLEAYLPDGWVDEPVAYLVNWIGWEGVSPAHCHLGPTRRPHGAQPETKTSGGHAGAPNKAEIERDVGAIAGRRRGR